MKATPLLRKPQSRQAFQQPQQKLMEQLITATWAVASSSLWPHQPFSEKEEADFQELIAEHFYNGKNSKRHFKELIERLCLAKRNVAGKRKRYISKPQDYLNIHYTFGLAGTATFLEQVKHMRKDVPEYDKGIRTLAKALLVFIEEQGTLSFHKGRKQLIQQYQFNLLHIYNATILHLQYPRS